MGTPLRDLGSGVLPSPGKALVLNNERYIEEPARWSGQEIHYKQVTAEVDVSATTEATAGVVLTADPLEFDGKIALIEFFSPYVNKGTTNINLVLYDDPNTGTAASVGKLAQAITTVPVYVARYLTPSAGFHKYSIRAFVDAGGGTVGAGTGVSTSFMPMFIRITRAGRQTQ